MFTRIKEKYGPYALMFVVLAALHAFHSPALDRQDNNAQVAQAARNLANGIMAPLVHSDPTARLDDPTSILKDPRYIGLARVMAGQTIRH